MQHFDDSLALSADAQAIADRLIATCDEFEHLHAAAPRVPVIRSARALIHRGSRANAVIIQPRWQGPLGMTAEWLLAQFCAPLLEGHDPDYVVFVDGAVWDGLSDEGRERLMFHELCHLVQVEDEFGVVRRHQDGRPMLKLVPHDYEAFSSEIRRYGIETCGIEAIAPDIVEGEARKRRRGLRIA